MRDESFAAVLACVLATACTADWSASRAEVEAFDWAAARAKAAESESTSYE